jgi:hypothetical protein
VRYSAPVAASARFEGNIGGAVLRPMTDEQWAARRDRILKADEYSALESDDPNDA